MNLLYAQASKNTAESNCNLRSVDVNFENTKTRKLLLNHLAKVLDLQTNALRTNLINKERAVGIF